MKVKYFVQKLYEGNCPSCGDYQNSGFPENVDKKCIECKRKEVRDAVLGKKLLVAKIEGNEIEGYIMYLYSKDKEIYAFDVTEFRKVER